MLAFLDFAMEVPERGWDAMNMELQSLQLLTLIHVSSSSLEL